MLIVGIIKKQMKHIKKKFRFEKQLSDSEFAEFEENHTSRNINEVVNFKPQANQKCYLMTDNKFIIESFFMNLHGNKVYIPEPDPTLIYYNNAYFYFKDINKQKIEINTCFVSASNKYITDEIKHKLYNYYGVCCGCVIFLFLTIESMINRTIPDEYVYLIENKNKTESYNKDQIQRHITFDEKYGKIISKIIGKSFEKQYPKKHQILINLKNFRDLIIHTKTQNNDNTPYAHIFKHSFYFKYEEAMDVVKDFVNFLQPDFIEECPCEKDF